jgi:hypothetical protein
MVREFTRLPVGRTVVLGLVSFCLAVASLGIDRTAYSRSEAQHLGFGYPVHFAFSDFASHYSPSSYPQTFRLNPWETPVAANPIGFLISWVLIYGALLACWLALRKTLRWTARYVRGLSAVT